MAPAATDVEGATPPAPPPAAAWTPLLVAGIQLLGELAAASRGEGASRWIDTDERTGQRYLKLPVPEPAALQRLVESLAGLLGGRR